MDDRLKKFAAVVEAGTFTKAAAMLHISQPALSVAVDKLEKSLDTVLIGSVGKKGVELTEAGRVVYAAALKHRAVDQNLCASLLYVGDEKQRLRIGLIDNAAQMLCEHEELLQTLETETELSLEVSDSTSLRAAVRSDRLDIAVVVADDAADAKLQIVTTGYDCMALVCEADAASEFQWLLDNAQQLPFISYVQRSMTARVAAKALERDDVSVRPTLYSTSPDVMLMMVLRGRGAALLPEKLVRGQLASGRLVHLRHGGRPYRVRRRLSAVVLRGRHISPQLQALARIIQL
ncbi:hypothetical protein CR970_01895 [Candidatus Saccharibacteria bacterium]|nr:MAG: hypothetical protein CR970_01895 [Candidatus Saccharibacteria bacterium]